MIWIALLVLSFVLGFIANRTTLCGVKAVDEVLSQRKAKVLGSFGKIVLWAFGVSAILEYGFNILPIQNQSYTFSQQTIFGGLILGAGAVLNGGCALHTLLRLGRGDLGMLISLIGISTSAALYELARGSIPGFGEDRLISTFQLDNTFKRLFTIIVIFWMLYEFARLARDFKFSECKQRVFADCYQLSTASALLGICNGILFSFVGTWAYTHTLMSSISSLIIKSPERSASLPISLWCLSLSLLVGIATSSYLKGRFTIVFRPKTVWVNYFIGGTFMGIGALMIPGGNDVLLLSAIPSGSPHAIPAYVSMLTGISIALLIKNKLSQQI